MPCTACGRPDALPLTPSTQEVLCPPCTAHAALVQASREHLHALLWPTLTAWARHWQAAGVRTPDLAATVTLYGTYWHPQGATDAGDDPYTAARAAVEEMLEADA